MKKINLIRKGLVLGVIILFIGTSIVPANLNTNQNKAVNKDNTTSTTEEKYYNLIGGVNITYGYRGLPNVIKIEWWKNPDRNFTYPIINGKVSLNYTIEFQTYSNGIYFPPRLSGLVTAGYIYYPYPYNETQFGTGVVGRIVPFWRAKGFPKTVTFVSVQGYPNLPPPYDLDNKSTIDTWNIAGAILMPRVIINNETRALWPNGKEIHFWANFTQE